MSTHFWLLFYDKITTLSSVFTCHVLTLLLPRDATQSAVLLYGKSSVYP